MIPSKKRLTVNKTTALQRPAKFSELNPIKYLWIEWKRMVQKQRSVNLEEDSGGSHSQRSLPIRYKMTGPLSL
uniref:Uncharacterized protein n=1 Tax=Anguilla anguilla TaxID=7936 RepID=A0A0E9QB36_ANGAN